MPTSCMSGEINFTAAKFKDRPQDPGALDKHSPEFPDNPNLQGLCQPHHQSLQNKDYEFLLPRTRCGYSIHKSATPISALFCLLLRYLSRTFPNYSEKFPKNFNILYSNNWVEDVCSYLPLKKIKFKKNPHFILISGWQKRKCLNLNCFGDPMGKLYICVWSCSFVSCLTF